MYKNALIAKGLPLSFAAFSHDGGIKAFDPYLTEHEKSWVHYHYLAWEKEYKIKILTIFGEPTKIIAEGGYILTLIWPWVIAEPRRLGRTW